ncbi:MAG: YncE family protein [Chitinophagaceae bacterium]|nr:YncE family protein [Chitinophagaceae bacterium]
MRFVCILLLVGCICTTAIAQTTASKKGLLLVLNKFENTLAFIDPVALKVTATVPTGDGPHEIIVSDDGQLAFVANYGSQQPGNSLSIIDINARKEIRRVDLGACYRPHGLAYQQGKVYFTSELSRTVGRYDFVSGKTDWLTGTGQNGVHLLTIAHHSPLIFTANRLSNTVSSIHVRVPPTPEDIVHIPVGRRPEGIDISPDDKELWVGNNDDGTISIIDVSSNKVKETISVGKLPIRVKFTPDGKLVLVSDHTGGELVIIEAASRKIIKRVKAEGLPVGILITPDGRKAFVARMESGIVSVLDLKKMEFTGSIQPGKGPDGMAWVE